MSTLDFSNIGMILSAGLGTRLRPITDHIPKALVEIDGMPIIDHVIHYMRLAGISKIVVNVHYLAEEIKQHLKKYHKEIIILEEPKILGTGGGILNAMRQLKPASMTIINCDNYFPYYERDNPIKVVMQGWQPELMDILALVKDVKEIPEQGQNADLFFDHRNALGSTTPIIWPHQLDPIMEPSIKTYSQSPGYVFMGVYIISASVFDDEIWEDGEIREFSIIRRLQNKRCYGIEYYQKWFDIGTPERLQLASQE